MYLEWNNTLRTVTAKLLAYILGCTDNAIRQREGVSMPEPLNPDAKPLEYDVRRVLMAVRPSERDLICAYYAQNFGIRYNLVVVENADWKTETPGYVPGASD